MGEKTKAGAVCQSCGMNMNSAEDFGTNADGSRQAEYCRYCYQKGAFTNDRTMEEMIESNLRFLDEYNAENGVSYTPEEAKEELSKYLATLKRWKR